MRTAVRLVVAALALVLGGAALGAGEAPAYAAFHAVAAVLALAAALVARGTAAPAFCLALGAADLYQAVASAAGWFPREAFRWTPTDDVVHLVLGPLLLVLGAAALLRPARGRS